MRLCRCPSRINPAPLQESLPGQGRVQLPPLKDGRLEVSHRGVTVKVIDVNDYKIDHTIRYPPGAFDVLPAARSEDNDAGIDILFNTVEYLTYLTETTGVLNVVREGTLVSLYGVKGMDNAFFTGGHMVYGAGKEQFKQLVSADVVAHELTHGLVQREGGLVYRGESGALNEGMADSFACGFELWLYKKFNGNLDTSDDISGKADWFIGEDISRVRPYMRNMADPLKHGGPKHYRGQNCADPANLRIDHGGVHINSSVIGHLFYLLCQKTSAAEAVRLFYEGFSRDFQRLPISRSFLR